MVVRMYTSYMSRAWPTHAIIMIKVAKAIEH